MKWGKKTSRSSVMTRVFPGTWLSKFKQTGDTSSGKKQQRGKLDFSPANSSLPGGRREARFYSLDNDAYWTLSFRKERGDGKRRIKPLSYDSEEEFLAAVSSFGIRGTQFPTRELEGIDEVVDPIKMKSSKNKKKRNRGAQLKKEEKNGRRSRKLKSTVQRKKKAEFGEDESSSSKEEAIPTETEKDGVEEEFQDSAVSNSRNHQNLATQNFSPSSNEEDDEDLDENSSNVSSEREQDFENKKFEENNVTTESQGEAACLSRRFRTRKMKQNRKKAQMARLECRIQALEDMKKARIKLKKEAKEQVPESSTIYNSLAVVKSSFNPQQDFRDSMVEMIRVKEIRRREELEELLACYLTLNSDGHHDLIINAFQQVWFELNGGVY